MKRNTRLLCARVASIAAVAGCMLPGRACMGQFVLVKDGKPAAAFVLTGEQEQVSSATRGFALSESIADFNEDLEECANCALPVAERDGGGTPVIRFGLEPRAAADTDRFDIAFPDDRTMLVTGSAVSVRWALNHVLEKHAGIRYLFRCASHRSDDRTNAKDGVHFPEITDLTVPKAPVRVAPDWNLSRRGAHNPYWNKRTGTFVYRTPCGHHLSRYAFPVREYMKRGQWPDYIFPVVNGKRLLRYKEAGNRWNAYCHGWQPCFTDPRVVDEAVKNLTAYLDRHPEAHGVSIGLNDMGSGFCECDTCRPLIGKGRNMAGYRDYSDIYFQWANRVADGVAEKHPDRLLGTLAYRETLEPPGFKLHRNIVPHITYDIFSCADPEVRASWTDLLKRWNAKTRYLGRWEYAWGDTVYQMPRVYFRLQQDMMRVDHANGVRAIRLSGVSGGMQDGPKKYLYGKLLWDVDLDLDTVMADWYRACVGPDAAPYLAEYFRVWEEIWREEAVKTSWFQSSKTKVYLSMANQGYLYAVRPGDLPRLRTLMDNVVRLANEHGDLRQRKRARWLMTELEYSEACIRAIGGHIFPPSGVAETADQALAYLEALPDALSHDARRPELHGKRFLHHLQPDRPERAQPYVHMALAQVAAKTSDPEVLEALEVASANTRLPSEIRGLLDVFVRMETGKPIESLLQDGGFEKGNFDWQQGTATNDRAYRGKQSLRLWLAPPFRGILCVYGRDRPHQRVKPGKYYVSMMVYVDAEHPDVESYVRFRATARNLEGEFHGAHFDSAHFNVPARQWTRLSLVANVTDNRDSLRIDAIYFYNYNRGDLAYIDDVVVVPIEVAGR